MDFWTSIKVLARRWYVFIPALALSGVVTLALYHHLKPTYEAKSIILLVPPKATPTGNAAVLVPSNPYLGFGNLNTVAAILSASETSPAAVSRLAHLGVTDTYTIVPDPLGQIPELNVTVDGKSSVTVLAESKTIDSDISQYLVSTQNASSAPQLTWITTNLLSPPNAALQNKSRVRVAGAVGAIAVVVSIALAFMAESVAGRRKQEHGSNATGWSLHLPRRPRLPKVRVTSARKPSPRKPSKSPAGLRSIGDPPAETSGPFVSEVGENIGQRDVQRPS